MLCDVVAMNKFLYCPVNLHEVSAYFTANKEINNTNELFTEINQYFGGKVDESMVEFIRQYVSNDFSDMDLLGLAMSEKYLYNICKKTCGGGACKLPSYLPTTPPSSEPSLLPSVEPTADPSNVPSFSPSASPTVCMMVVYIYFFLECSCY